MTREELEHIIRASAGVTDQYEFMIVGSQSILGPVPNPPEVFKMSAEADIYRCKRRNWRTGSTAPSVKARSFTRRTVTTRKAWAPKPLYCRKAGLNASTGCRAPRPTSA